MIMQTLRVLADNGPRQTLRIRCTANAMFKNSNEHVQIFVVLNIKDILQAYTICILYVNKKCIHYMHYLNET